MSICDRSCAYGCGGTGLVYIEKCSDANLPEEVFGPDQDAREAPYVDDCACVINERFSRKEEKGEA
jgi:hypothetical protein